MRFEVEEEVTEIKISRDIVNYVTKLSTFHNNYGAVVREIESYRLFSAYNLRPGPYRWNFFPLKF